MSEAGDGEGQNLAIEYRCAEGHPDRLPTLAAGFRVYIPAGSLISYSTSLTDTYRNAGTYIGKILKDAKPADLPGICSKHT